jgi:hypothetical protein
MEEEAIASLLLCMGRHRRARLSLSKLSSCENQLAVRIGRATLTRQSPDFPMLELMTTAGIGDIGCGSGRPSADIQVWSATPLFYPPRT